MVPAVLRKQPFFAFSLHFFAAPAETRHGERDTAPAAPASSTSQPTRQQRQPSRSSTSTAPDRSPSNLSSRLPSVIRESRPPLMNFPSSPSSLRHHSQPPRSATYSPLADLSPSRPQTRPALALSPRAPISPPSSQRSSGLQGSAPSPPVAFFSPCSLRTPRHSSAAYLAVADKTRSFTIQPPSLRQSASIQLDPLFPSAPWARGNTVARRNPTPSAEPLCRSRRALVLSSASEPPGISCSRRRNALRCRRRIRSRFLCLGERCPVFAAHMGL